MKFFIKIWVPVLVWASLIFFFSANPNPYRYLPEGWRSLVPLRVVSDSSLAEWIGQVMHFVEYAILALLLSRAMQASFPGKARIAGLTILFTMLFALSDEVHQLFVPGRAFQIVDLIIDLVGSLFGVFLWGKLKAES